MTASRRPLVISHRTNAGTMPENTLAGVDAAIRDGAEGVEIDVRATADGHVVLLHDDALARTTGDPRALAGVTLAELESLRVAPAHDHPTPEPVPTLDAVLERMAGHGVLVIEVKDAGIEDAVARAVRTRQAEAHCWIWAFDPTVAADCRRVLPEVPVALLAAATSPDRYGYASAIEAAAAASLAAVSLHHTLVDAETVQTAHGRGLRVYTWTVNAPEDIRRVAEAGVDAICGDFPQRIAEVLSAAEGA